MLKFENHINGRFYYLQIKRDMLNDLVINIIFGGRGVTRLRTIACDSRLILHKEIEKISKTRLRRGYVLVV